MTALFRSRRLALCWTLAAFLASLPAFALDAPTGKVLLTVSGELRLRNAPEGAAFDMAMLEKLPQRSFSTRTPWYPQARKFTDLLLAYLLDDKPMPVREKGPLVLMFPFDTQPELRSAINYGRAAWQLKQLELR